MVAFILPIVWMFTGVSVMGFFYKLSSTLGLSGLVFENWKMKKCAELGVEPKTLGLALDLRDSARNRVAAELGIVRQEERRNVFEVDPSSVPDHPWLAMKYALVGSEFENFLDGMRHLALLDGVGPEAERLKEMLKGTKLKYEDLSFLWEGFGCDFAKLQKLSKKRLEDVGFRTVAGLPLFD